MIDHTVIVRVDDFNYLKYIFPLDKNDKILDIGCGYGRVTNILAADGYNICGVDLSEKMILCAKNDALKANLNVEFAIGNMVKLPYKDSIFNKAFCIWSTFNHLLYESEQVKAVNEIHRILKKGGIGLIEMVDGEKEMFVDTFDKDSRGVKGRIASMYVMSEFKIHVFLHNRKTLTSVFEKSNFEEYDVREVDICGSKEIVGILYK